MANALTANARLGGWAALIVLLCILVNAGGAHLARPAVNGGWLAAAWVLTVLLICGLIGVIGSVLHARPAGILIDNRNRISLSKLQMTAWTVLVVSGLCTLSAASAVGLKASLAIDGNLLVLLGISSTSLVATPAILSLKGDSTNDRAGESVAAALWVDVFRGDDVSNADVPDVSKIQQALITLVVLVSYAFLLLNALKSGVSVPDCIVTAKDKCMMFAFPAIDEQLLWLIGISHAGYLAYKAVPHTAAAKEAAGTPDDDGAVG